MANSVSCLAVCLHLGMSPETIAARMAVLEPVAMRLEVKEGRSGCTLINDSYNSDYNSLDIALDFMNRRPDCAGRKRTLILSDIEQAGGALGNGTGIGDGTVSGPLCVCRTPEEVPHKFRTGDVLVVPYTNNDLLPYMKEAAAVISEEISPEVHTATVGLLLHKPVIIGAVHATRRLSDGVQVSVDCARGIVQGMPQ